MKNAAHMDWLEDTGERVKTSCGREIEIWSLSPEDDAAILSAWAKHFRQHYISDDDLPIMVDGTDKANKDYLESQLFPDVKNPPGPSLRSGDFGEILMGDFVEFVLGYWCPRELRFRDRWNRNEATKGCDVIGFKFAADAPGPNDELFIFESKSGMSITKKNRMQDAIDDSSKDELRESMSLNAIKRRFVDQGAADKIEKVKRFQNFVDRPFRRINGAAAILDDEVFAATDLTQADASAHPNQANLKLIVIRGPGLMKLVHALYERAANEA